MGLIVQPTSLKQVAIKYKVFLVDNQGVLRTIEEPHKRAYQALNKLREAGKQVFLFSNTASHTPDDLRKELESQGVELKEEQIITSGLVLLLALKELGLEGKPILCLGNSATEEYVKMAGGIIEESEDAEVIVIGHYPEECSGRSLGIFFKLYKKNRPALLLNTDSYVPVNNHARSSGPAYGWKRFDEDSGKKLIGVGKPFPYMYRLAIERAREANQADFLAVGDYLETDIMGARDAGIDSLLVLSGLHAIDCKIGRLDQLVQQYNAYPTYAVPNFEFEDK